MPLRVGRVPTRLSLAAGAVFVLGACADRPVPTVGIAGPLARPGVLDVAQATLAAKGWDSTRIRLFHPTTGTGLAGEVERAAELARTAGMAVVVGHTGSRGSLLGAPIYGEAGIPLVVPLGTSRRLREAGPLVYRMVPDDSVEGAFISSFLADVLHARSATVFYTADEYGLGLRAGVEAGLRQRGIALVDAAAIGDGDCLGTQDEFLLTVRASLRRGQPDAVVLAAPSVAAACVTRNVRAQLPGVRIVTGDGAEPSTGFVARAGRATDSTYFAAFWNASDTAAPAAEFIAAFRRIVGRDPGASEGVWYDAIMVAAEAAVSSGGRPARARSYLASLGGSRAAWAGVTGPVTFSVGRNLRLVMLQHAGGRTSMVPGP